MLPFLPMKILLPSSTVSSKKYTYSIIHRLFQLEKILHHLPPLLFIKNTTTFSMASLEKTFSAVRDLFQLGCIVLTPSTTQL
jgi:hypothetical protein